MPRRIEQSDVQTAKVRERELSLFRENGDAALSLHAVGVEISITMVDTPLPAYGAGQIEQTL